jgi:serine/threonine protein kinase
MLRELEVWLRLKHSSIVPLLGTARVVGSPLLALVSQWMPSGTLSEYLGKHIAPSARIGLVSSLFAPITSSKYLLILTPLAKGIAEGLNYRSSISILLLLLSLLPI